MLNERILHHLRVHGPATTATLTSHLRAPHHHVTEAVGRLASQGAITRVPRDQQRRNGPRWMVTR